MVIGSRRWRIEWLGEHVETPQGSLFPQDVLDAAHKDIAIGLEDIADMRTVVALDPTFEKHGQGDEAGLIVAGILDGKYYVLEDRSGHMSPLTWANRAVKAYRDYNATALVVEINSGGDLIPQAIRQVDDSVNIKEVKATHGKIDRATPIAAMYEAGDVKHLGDFPELEQQMLLCVHGRKASVGDDRLDALIHALQYMSTSMSGGWLDIAWVNGDVKYTYWYRPRTEREMRQGVKAGDPMLRYTPEEAEAIEDARQTRWESGGFADVFNRRDGNAEVKRAFRHGDVAAMFAPRINDEAGQDKPHRCDTCGGTFGRTEIAAANQCLDCADIPSDQAELIRRAAAQREAEKREAEASARRRGMPSAFAFGTPDDVEADGLRFATGNDRSDDHIF